ncbi:MAG: hypothetical protein ACD_71C00182G0003 [uncultured bacterium (gcode 4)]|uniref:Uncharacterized protein n=1 Tax=uncultured bacterium (gcode 4) TaxID=1234023 RepID=K1Z438_9BACT|nr:MAG: hypothetical protein ACD_71C00182G0003 [uncultured bacterium (gcode 4)]
MKIIPEDCPSTKNTITPELPMPQICVGDILESAEEIIDRFSLRMEKINEFLSWEPRTWCCGIYSDISKEHPERVIALLLDKEPSEKRSDFCKNPTKIFQETVREYASKNIIDLIPNIQFTLMEFLKNTYDHGSWKAFVYLCESDKEIVLIYQELWGKGIFNELRSQKICENMSDSEIWQRIFQSDFSSKMGNGINYGLGMSFIFSGMTHIGFDCSLVDSSYVVRAVFKDGIAEVWSLNVVWTWENRKWPIFIARKSLY